MQLNSYETIYILKPDIAEDIKLSLTNTHKLLIREEGGQNILVQHRGRRHLSYNILHYYDGIYVQINYDGNGSLVRILEESIRSNDKILRCLTTKSSQKNMSVVNI